MTEPPATAYYKVRRRRFVAMAVAACVVVAMLAGVYEIGLRRSNPAAADCQAAVDVASHVAPLAHGEIAALAMARKPFLVPDFAFNDGDGRPRKLADWRGRTVLLNLWATWCVPCRKEMPALDALQAELGGPDFEVVAINIDTRDPQKPHDFLNEAGIKHLGFYADRTAKAFQELKLAGKAFGMPTTLVINRSGCEIGAMAGPAEWASEDGVKFIRAALAADKETVTR